MNGILNRLKFFWYTDCFRPAVKFFALLSSVLFSVVSQAQSTFSAGIQLAAVVSIGTHHTNIGARLNAYAAVDYAQLNIGTTWRFHAIDLGGRSNFGEWRHHVGLVGLFGPSTMPVNFQLDGIYHQSKRAYSFGYMYLLWQDKVGTTQRSGAFNLGISHIDIYFENDILAGQGRDRFRTGFISVSYRNYGYRLTAASEMWTGETRGSTWDKTPGYKMPGGHRNLGNLPYGRTSHGIAFIGFQQQLFSPFSYCDVRAGIDNDNIRHFLQNRFSHDLVFLPKKVPRHTPHYPRLDKDGNPVFQKKLVRPSKPYFQTGLNDLNAY